LSKRSRSCGVASPFALTESVLAGALAVILFVSAAPSAAQTYPSKPVRFVVPFSPGGSSDILARTIAIPLERQWRQTVVIDNRGGGGTLVGTQLASRAASDGYTLLITNIAYTLVPSVHGEQGFEATQRLRGVVQLVSQPTVIAAHPTVTAKTVAQLVDYARAKPGAINFGSSGVGSVGHLAGEMLKQKTGIDITHVPYKGGAPAAVDTISGLTQLVIVGLPTTFAHVKAGRLKLLAVTDPRRAAAIPDVPTVSESGIPGYSVSNWVGVLAPAGLSAALVQRLNADINASLKGGDTGTRLEAQGFELVGGDAAKFDQFISHEIRQWTAVVKKAGITSL
jgi:tripartite-type tricarboxylate transporter receptor subunit TctC